MRLPAFCGRWVVGDDEFLDGLDLQGVDDDGSFGAVPLLEAEWDDEPDDRQTVGYWDA